MLLFVWVYFALIILNKLMLLNFELIIYVLVAEVDKMSDKIKKAKEFQVHVVDEEFLDKIAKGNIVALIQQHSIAPWGADVSCALFGLFFV